MRGDGRVTAQSTAAHGAIGIAAWLPAHIELPSQYADRHGANATQLQPEQRLMLRVLEDAVATYQKYAFARDPRGRALYREAEAWIASDDRDWLYSFARICDALGLGTDYLRRGLDAWKARVGATTGDDATRTDAAGVTLARLRALDVGDASIATACGVSCWTVRAWRARRFTPGPDHQRRMDALLVEAELGAPRDEVRVLIHGMRGRGWTYGGIAAALGVADTAVGTWARGVVQPTAAHAAALRTLAGRTREAAAC